MEEIPSKIEGLGSFSKKTREWSCWNCMSRLSQRKRWMAHRNLSWDFAQLGLGNTELTEPGDTNSHVLYSCCPGERLSIAQPEGDKCMDS